MLTWELGSLGNVDTNPKFLLNSVRVWYTISIGGSDLGGGGGGKESYHIGKLIGT